MLAGSEDPDQTARAQANLYLRYPHIPEDTCTFSHGEAHLMLINTFLVYPVLHIKTPINNNVD